MPTNDGFPRDIVTHYLAYVWNERALERAAEFIAPDYDPGVPMPTRGPDAAKQLVQLFLAAFPDFALSVSDVFGEGDRIAVRYQFSGTHQGPWMNLAATQRSISIEGITIYQICEGKIARTWFSYDALGLLQQLQ